MLRCHETDFDRAMEDTSLALSTGYWRTRDGQMIQRAAGKSRLVNPDWRSCLDDVVERIDEARRRLRQALNLDAMFYEQRGSFRHEFYDEFDDQLRGNSQLAGQLDSLRTAAIKEVNALLEEIGDPPLTALR